jgi:hypothetical protein
MPLSTIINEVKSITGVTDDARATAAVRTAARELWQAGEYPGELREVRIQVETTSLGTTSGNTNSRYATVPYFVHEIRKIKSPTGRMPVDYQNVTRDYYGWLDIQSLGEVRLVAITPLSRRIVNSGRLTFTRKLADSTEISITIGGTTDVASYVEETVIIEASELTATTTHCYTDVTLIRKSAVATSDIIVSTPDGQEIAYLPNHTLESRYKLIEFRGPENATVDQLNGVYDILYKPVLPEITETTGYFPPEYDLVLTWIAVSHIYMSQEDKIAQGKHYRNLASEVLAEFEANATLGKDLRRPSSFTSSAFITNPSTRI